MPRLTHKTLVYGAAGAFGGSAAWAFVLALSQTMHGGLLTEMALGSFAGTLPLGAINLKGSALAPAPAIVVNFKSFSTGCATPSTCSVEVADTVLQQGQGMHGSFGRGDTQNFMAAFGPDFKTGFVDDAPASNADIGKTIAAILGFLPESHGKLVGRPLTEAFPGGAVPQSEKKTVASAPSGNGLKTILNYQTVGETKYFDSAGFEGRTVGLQSDAAIAESK